MIETYESVIIDIDLEALRADFRIDPAKAEGLTAEQQREQLERATVLAARFLARKKRERQASNLVE